jgi:hypothetical protein
MVSYPQFKYLETIAKNKKLTQKGIKWRLCSGQACYHHSVHNFLSSRLESKSAKIIIHKTIILPIALYECET